MDIYLSVLQLFLWPLEGTADVEVDGETLDEALTRINANINSLPRLTNFPHGISAVNMNPEEGRLSTSTQIH